MEIEDLFPVNPYEPTAKFAAVSQAPFVVPWAKGKVRYGSGFNTQRTQSDTLWIERSAFQGNDKTSLHYRKCQSTSIIDESGTNSATSSEDAKFTISASVGGDFLGASGRGKYDKNIRSNNNTSSISVHTEHVCGQIDAWHSPRLSSEAIRLLKASPDPISDFRQTYGDFYVAGFQIGAVNSTRVSGQFVNKAFFEMKQAELTVTAFVLEYNKSINEVSHSFSNNGGLRVDAFDSIADFKGGPRSHTASTWDDCITVSKLAAENKQNAMKIARRTTEILSTGFALGLEATVHQDVVDRLCDQGLVVGVVLAPFTLLREYRSLLQLRRILDSH